MATNKCRATVKRLDCGSDLTGATNSYPAFTVCLPFGRSLTWDGTGLRFSESGTPIADGVYGLITVQNGCIVDADEQPVCEYTAQPCNPAASPCDESGTGSVVLQPGESNILNFDSSGRLGAQINYETSTEGLVISGYGTTTNPLRINYTPGAASKTYLYSGTTSVLPVSGSGTSSDPYYVSHEESVLGAGTYGPFTVDTFGHVTGFSEEELSVSSIIAGEGVDVTKNGTVYTIGLPRKTASGRYQLGGYVIKFDGQGRLDEVEQNIDLPVEPASQTVTYDPTFNNFVFNPFGNLVGTVAKNDTADDIFSTVLTANRDETLFTITTTKAAYFKITYKGALPVSYAVPTVPAGYVVLPAPYTVYVGEATVPAYAHYANSNYIDEVVAITDAYFGAGTYNIAIESSTEDYSFGYVGILTIELVKK